MQKIIPHFWFNREAIQAAEFYVSLFSDSKVTFTSQIKDTPSGDCDIVEFQLHGHTFMAISAGPEFSFTPSISISVQCETEKEIDDLYAQLVEGGKVLMPLQKYDFGPKYCWIADRYGVTWQLNLRDDYENVKQKICPFLLFTQEMSGKAEEAMEFYCSVFPKSEVVKIYRHGAEQAELEGQVAHADFKLVGSEVMASDGGTFHEFTFNEAISLIVICKDQEEIDYYWEKLSAVPEAEQCGWLKDMYGVSWQIVPQNMEQLMRINPEKTTPAMLSMKKIIIKDLEEAGKA